MASLKYDGNSSFQAGTLGSSYTSGGTSLILTGGHGARFPSSGDFWVRVEDEVFKCTARSTDTLTVVGAQDGTSAANHNSGSGVEWRLPKSGLDQLRQDQCQTGTDAAKAAEKAGNLYLPNDGFVAYRDTGSVYSPWGPLFPFTAPVDGDFAWINQGGATVTTTNGGIVLYGPSSGSPNHRVRKKTAPSTPYNIDIAFLVDSDSANFAQAGLLFRQSSDGKLLTWAIGQDGLPTSADWTSPTAFSANNAFVVRRISSPVYWLRIRDDGTTNRTLYTSANGITWSQAFQEARTTFLTADEVGFYVNSENNDEIVMTLLHWKES